MMEVLIIAQEGLIRMKMIFLAAVVFCLCVGTARSYDDTLITDQTEVGGFAAVSVRFIEAKEELGVLAGGRVGALINHRWGIGAGGYGTVAKPDHLELEGLDHLEISYGGLILEYTVKPHSVLHISLPVLIGGGQVQFAGEYVDPDSGEDSESFFVVEPELSLEFNVTRNLRLDLGVGYLHVNGMDLADITDEDLSGVSGAVTFKMGSF
jgi:hypothetical protein